MPNCQHFRAEQERLERYYRMTTLAQKSSKAWRLLKNLNVENKPQLEHTNVSANEIAHQLIKNGKTKITEKTSKG